MAASIKKDPKSFSHNVLNIFDKIKNGLKNFAHNFLNITNTLYTTWVWVAGILLWAFYAAPFIPVLFQCIIMTVVAAVVFSAAHHVVDFFANMFSDRTKVEATVEVKDEATNTSTTEKTLSSTRFIQNAFTNNPTTVVNTSALTASDTNNPARKITAANDAANQDNKSEITENRHVTFSIHS